MPRYKVIQPCFLDGVLREIGEVIEFSGAPGKALLPLEAASKPALTKPAVSRKTEG
ncbi:hypothetical protein [Insolitispirillum peregrinum]|uniref:hypothetical protein n=1 Tax=Insolitispirillum peregrinum TaxID=80876 RepID=UPI003614A600